MVTRYDVIYVISSPFYSNTHDTDAFLINSNAKKCIRVAFDCFLFGILTLSVRLLLFFLFSILIFSEKENWQFSIKIPLKCWNNAFWLTKVLGKICKKASPQTITVEHNTNLLLLPTSETLGRMGKRFGEQGYLGSFGWTSLNYDWSMVFKATKQTKLLFTQIKPKHSFPQFSKETLLVTAIRGREK